MTYRTLYKTFKVIYKSSNFWKRIVVGFKKKKKINVVKAIYMEKMNTVNPDKLNETFTVNYTKFPCSY